jgi:choline dehydrogenase-like flavoprotein
MAIDRRGSRASTYKAFLDKETAIKRRGHLTIYTDAVASSLDVDKQAGLIRGVYVRPILGHTGDDIHVKARREVIICCGAVCSPLILMHSGIGLKAQLEDHDIPMIKELPVGENLQDHCSFAIMLELLKSETISMLESIRGLWQILLWIFLGTGLMSTGSTPQSIFLRTTAIDDETMSINAKPGNTGASKPSNVPDAETMSQPVSSFERHVPGRSLISLFPTLMQPRSTGSIELAGKDPLMNPRINHPLLNELRDLVPIRRAVRFAMRLAEEFQKLGYPYPAPLTFAPGVNLDLLRELKKSAPTATAGSYTFASKAGDKPKAVSAPNLGEQASSKAANTWRDVTDDEIDDYVKRIGMDSLHLGCTCSMSQDDRSGVVDQRLRVHGFKNLRIADASIFPITPSARTMAPIIMIAERCADSVKDAWKERQ